MEENNEETYRVVGINPISGWELLFVLYFLLFYNFGDNKYDLYDAIYNHLVPKEDRLVVIEEVKSEAKIETEGKHGKRID